MIIPIDDTYRLMGDEHSWQIQKATKCKRKGVQVIEWRSFKYYYDITLAVQNLSDMMVRTSEAFTLTEALAEVKRVTTMLSMALQPQFRVTVGPPEREKPAQLAATRRRARVTTSKQHHTTVRLVRQQ